MKEKLNGVFREPVLVVEQSIPPGQTINKRKTCISNLFTDYDNGDEDLLMLLSELLNKVKAIQVVGNPPVREVYRC